MLNHSIQLKWYKKIHNTLGLDTHIYFLPLGSSTQPYEATNVNCVYACTYSSKITVFIGMEYLFFLKWLHIQYLLFCSTVSWSLQHKENAYLPTWLSRYCARKLLNLCKFDMWKMVSFVVLISIFHIMNEFEHRFHIFNSKIPFSGWGFYIICPFKK